jgi:hypothetical protein
MDKMATKDTPRRALKGHTQEVMSVAFSADGTLMISGSLDGCLNVWRVRSCQHAATLIALPSEDWITYTPEGYFVGSDAVTENVMMAFEREFGGVKMREHVAAVSPNPAKVAEALQDVVTSAPVPARRERRSAKLASAQPKALPPGAHC